MAITYDPTSKIDREEQTTPVVDDGNLENTISSWQRAQDGRVRVHVDDGQYLTDGNMTIDDLGGLDEVPEWTGYAARKLRESVGDTFNAPVSWETGIVENLTVEEAAGAILSAEAEIRELRERNRRLRSGRSGRKANRSE